MSGPPKRLVPISLTLLICSLVIGCAEETGPQFANEPAPTRPATSTAVAGTPMAIQGTPVAATPSSIEDVLATRGAPDRVFVVAGSEVWAVSSSSAANRVYEATPEERVIAIDAAPGADQVAIVLGRTGEAGERTDVAIIDAAGELVARLDGLASLPATPEPGGGESVAAAIDWSPQADRVLVSFMDGAIVELLIGSDEVSTLLPPLSNAESIVHPTWSPTGEAVAFIATSDDGRKRSLRILDTRDGTVREILTPVEGRFVVDYAWMPNVISLLFTEGGELGGAVTGIDLWRIDADGENRELVVSAGTVAPVARITNVAPSPDGRSVAYAVLVPGDTEPLVDSVWVRELGSRLGFRIQMPSVAEVDNVSWTNRGLVIEVVAEGRGSRLPAQALVQVTQHGEATALWAAPLAASTPVGGTPSATPRAS